MPFKLEMKNVSDQIIQYDSQSVGVNDSMSVVRSSGESVPYVAGPSSTFGGKRPLKPGEVTVLCPRLDLSGDYLMIQADTYTVRFGGADRAYGEVPFPPSNELEVKVAEGTAIPAQAATEKLLGILPDGKWELSLRGEALWLICNRTGHKSDMLLVKLEFHKGRPKEEAGDGKGRVLLGSKDGVNIYLGEQSDPAEVEKAWKGYRAKIVEALELGEK